MPPRSAYFNTDFGGESDLQDEQDLLDELGLAELSGARGRLGGLSGMSSESRLEDLLGLGPPPEEEPADAESFSVSPIEGFLERLAAGGEPELGQPEGFGQGLLAGLGRGAVSRGQQVAQRRAKFEAAQAQRARDRQQANLQASRDYRQARALALREQTREGRRSALAQAKEDLENPVVTDALIASYPDIPALKGMKGQRVGRDLLQRTQFEAPGKKAVAERTEAAAARQEAAAARAEAAAERSNRLAQSSTLGQLSQQYDTDEDIKTYRTAALNSDTARAAAGKRNGVGDLALIISYVRATEPGVLSVVRQEEQRNVRDAIGAFDKAAPQLNLKRFLKGDLLSENARRQIVAAAESFRDARKPQYDAAQKQFQARAAFVGVPFNLVERQYAPPSGTPGKRPPLSSFVSP